MFTTDRYRRASRAACEALECRRHFAAGDLDPTFGDGGSVVLNFPGLPFDVRDAARQADEKIVLVGQKGDTPAVVRLNADGTLDGSFGFGGLRELSADYIDEAAAVALQFDGGIVVAGYDDYLDDDVFSLVRLLPNGSPDATFGGGNGYVRTPIDDGIIIGSSARAYDVAIQADGRIVAAGEAFTGSLDANDDFAIVRYLPNGSLDTGFGDGGIRIAGFDGQDGARAVAIDYTGNFQTNPYWGTIVVVGYKEQADYTPPVDFAVARLTPGGDFDNSFDGNGRLITAFPGGDSVATGVVIQPGGKIVVTGTRGPGLGRPGPHDFAMARYLPNGSLDPFFGPNGNGLVVTDFGGNDFAFGATAGYLGGLVLSGTTSGLLGVAAYTRDGHLDGRFDGDGLLTAPVRAGNAFSDGAVFTAPGRKLVVAGAGAVSRVVDVASVVSIGSFNPDASEPGQNVATFAVARTEALPYGERVYLNVSGTALRPGNFRRRPPDFNAAGMTFGFESSTEPTFVDIPAGQNVVLVTVTPTDDTAAEGDETAVFSIAPFAFYDIGTPASTTIVIADNEPPPVPQVAARRVFYDGSAFDAGPGGSDDAAVAPDKQALLPGGTASFANVTSYTKGINGLMVDVSNLPNNGAGVTAADFAFRSGAGGNPASWPAVAVAPAVSVRPNAGANGSDRVVLTWPAGTLRNTWLQVTVRATAATGLPQPDVFCFGNLVGETGDFFAGRPLAVTVVDFLRTRQAPWGAAAVASPYDFDRDGRVGVRDHAIARSARGGSLALFVAPPPALPAQRPLTTAAEDDEANDPALLESI
ncbi:MAG TPA: hypothetical protein VFB66_17345 [Tepidisphaeraceae bacterium]|nr:hypothetical protein [Tepidisphaeraceae bacterium]